jgi:hypothetical protein
MVKKYYRADARSFAPGDAMGPQKAYQEAFDVPGREHGKAMESLLESCRPENKPRRSDCLFVFENEVAAKRHWRTNDGLFLYEVEIDESEVRHRGDMNLTDAIGGEYRKLSTPDQTHVRTLADKYWKGGVCDNACIETLVPHARVVKQIKGRSNVRAFLLEHRHHLSKRLEVAMQLLSVESKVQDA